MLSLVERECQHWTLNLVERNMHQVGMLPLVETDCHHWIIPLLERDVHQGIPLVDNGDQILPLVESGNRGQWVQASTFASLL